MDKLRVVYARDEARKQSANFRSATASRLLEVPLDQADALMIDATTLEQEIAA